MEVTPNWPPYCVVWLKLKDKVIGNAPLVGVKPLKLSTPPTGAVTWPELPKVRVWAGPAEAPLTVILTDQVLGGAACCEKNMVAGYALPSESYTVVDVDWL